MTQREKVIKELECCVSLSHNGSKCANCDYADEFRNGDCETYLLRDAIALLKALEPVDVDEWPDEFLCPTCKTRLARRSHDDCVLLVTNDTPNFCWVCGQAVKWE